MSNLNWTKEQADTAVRLLVELGRARARHDELTEMEAPKNGEPRRVHFGKIEAAERSIKAAERNLNDVAEELFKEAKAAK